MSVYNHIKDVVAIDRLSIEIGDADFSTNYLYSTFTSPNLSIFFDESLTSPEQTTLSGLVASHSGQEIYLSPGMVAVSDGSGSITFVSDADEISGTSFKFLDLNDTPSTYSGSSDKFTYVNSTASGIGFRPKYHEDYYVEYTYSGIRVIQEDIWEDDTKTKQILSKVIQRSAGLVSQITQYVYDYDTGTEIISTAVSTPTRSNGRVAKIDKIKT